LWQSTPDADARFVAHQSVSQSFSSREFGLVRLKT